jgi:Xaa-Pro dipeptidase
MTSDGAAVDDIEHHYPAHFAEYLRRAERAMALCGLDGLLIGSGSLNDHFLDDLPLPFRASPLFRSWIPELAEPDCWIEVRPGQKPRLIYTQPADYWHRVPADPVGAWVEHFDIRIIRDPAQARAELPMDPARYTILAPAGTRLGDRGPDNPSETLAVLHYPRASKTPFELALMRQASLIGARAHLAAEAAFRAGESEWGIHLMYMAAAQQGEHDLPYGNIIGLNEHAAVLHWQHQDRTRPEPRRSFLIDAGASWHGYASDITRTHAAEAGLYADLIVAVDRLQQTLAGQVRAGVEYSDLHLQSHRLLAEVLREAGVLRISADEAVERGVSSTFFPHGLGHLIGLQVHDVGGFQGDELGRTTLPRPDGHPWLRLTRRLEANFVVTIEPGLYFIPMLLDQLRAGPHRDTVDWHRIEQLLPYGGIRIEDDVRVTDGEPENLTRDAFAALG